MDRAFVIYPTLHTLRTPADRCANMLVFRRGTMFVMLPEVPTKHPAVAVSLAIADRSGVFLALAGSAGGLRWPYSCSYYCTRAKYGARTVVEGRSRPSGQLSWVNLP